MCSCICLFARIDTSRNLPYQMYIAAQCHSHCASRHSLSCVEGTLGRESMATLKSSMTRRIYVHFETKEQLVEEGTIPLFPSSLIGWADFEFSGVSLSLNCSYS
nr:PREDICTED: uncharacterized protein LOC109033172 [Bemisia tabaci]